MQLNQFNGGLSTRLSPYLIGINEATACTNLDINSGVLKSVKDDTNLHISGNKSLRNFKDNWLSSDSDRSYAEFLDILYFSDASGNLSYSKDGITVFTSGIEAPVFIAGDNNELIPADLTLFPVTNEAVDTINSLGYAASIYEDKVLCGYMLYNKVVLFDLNGLELLTITKPETHTTDRTFGEAVCLTSNYILVGCPRGIDTSSQYPTVQGVVYQYGLDGTFIRTLTRADNTPNYGYSITSNGTLAVVSYYSTTNAFWSISNLNTGSETLSHIIGAGDSLTLTSNSTYVCFSVGRFVAGGYTYYQSLTYSWAQLAIPDLTVTQGNSFNSIKAVIGSTKLATVSSTGVVTVNTAPAVGGGTTISIPSGYGVRLNDRDVLAINKDYLFIKCYYGSEVRVLAYNLTSYTNVGYYSNITPSGMVAKDTIFIMSNKSTPNEIHKYLNAGTYTYYYTFYNKELGIESAPAGPKDIVVLQGETVGITVTKPVDVESLATHYRLYRIVSGTPLLMKEVPINYSVSTQIIYEANLDILGGEALASYTNYQAPDGIQYLTEYSVMLFGAVGSELRYTDVGLPDYWSEFNLIKFDSTITGLGATANGLLVFTKFKTYIVTGNEPGSLSKYLLNPSQGCVDHKSIHFVNNTLVWVSTDGICASTGGEVKVMSRDKLGKLNILSTSIVTSTVFDDKYYLALTDKVLVGDFSLGVLVFYELDIVCNGMTVYNDVLHYSKASEIYSVGTISTYKDIYYKSGKITEGKISNLKNYKDIYIYVDYTDGAIFKVYIDSVLVNTTTLVVGYNNIKLPQGSKNGYCIEFEISGKVELSEIEYKVEERQNGR